jgi:hypothetical protein
MSYGTSHNGSRSGSQETAEERALIGMVRRLATGKGRQKTEKQHPCCYSTVHQFHPCIFESRPPAGKADYESPLLMKQYQNSKMGLFELVQF